MKLELKHVAAYLPYKVRYKSARWSLPLVLDVDSVNEVVNRQYKLHLRPLSDLTKEIEHNGERFVPIRHDSICPYGEGFFEHIIQDGTFEYFDTPSRIGFQYIDPHGGGESFYFHKGILAFGKEVKSPPGTAWIFKDNGSYSYENLLKLFEWHFDVFGLIENGLAIDINTLKNQGNPSGSY